MPKLVPVSKQKYETGRCVPMAGVCNPVLDPNPFGVSRAVRGGGLKITLQGFLYLGGSFLAPICIS